MFRDAPATVMSMLGTHIVRPDRIVRTGVLQPIVGYQPQNAVMMVTSEFTSGPASGMQLAGLRGLGFAPIGQGPIATWFKTLGARIKMSINAARAGQMMLTDGSGAATSAVITQVGVDPRTQIMSPQQSAMAQMANFMTYRDVPQRGNLFPQRRWNTYYYAG